MECKVERDAILLGFGHGFLKIAEQIVRAAKEMRKEIHAEHNIDFPRIHIVDHDLDAENNNVPLPENEFIIRIHGDEKVRCQCEEIRADQLIAELKKVILENIAQFAPM